jgi:hypothetical protein
MKPTIANNSSPLSLTDAARLSECESVVERGSAVFLEVGRALMAIRDGNLYRGTHRTFAEYCSARWGFEKSHAHRLIQSALIAESIPPMGDVCVNERQLRPLALVPAENRGEVWAQAVLTAPRTSDDRPLVTGTHVLETVEAWKASSASAQSAISGGTSFDVTEIEAFKPRETMIKNGSPLVSTKDRKEAVKNVDALSRSLEKLGLYEKYVQPLSQIREDLTTTNGERRAA